MAGRVTESAALVGDEVAELAAELALLARDAVADSKAERAELAREEASLSMLLRAEPAAPVAEERAEPTLLVMDAPPDVISEPIEEMTDAPLLGMPPTAEVIWERMESTWALATPAARTAVAMVEKRILVIWSSCLCGRVDERSELMWSVRESVYVLWNVEMGGECKARWTLILAGQANA